MTSERHNRPAVFAAALIGAGMGGFFDGIVLHQILQWHNMMSAKVPADTMAGMKANMVWDGAFHAFVWAVTVAGVILLWRAARRGGDFPWRRLAGGFLLGWGAFNVIEGVIDHHLLGLHHVLEGEGLSVWDYGFLAWGVAMVAAASLLLRERRTRMGVNSRRRR